MLTILGILLILVGIIKIVWGRMAKSRQDQINAVRENNARHEDRYYHKNEPDPFPDFPIGGKIWYWFAGAMLVIMMNGMFFWAEAGTAYAVQYPWGGDKMVKTQGLKLQWWGRVIPLSYEISVKDIKLKSVKVDGEWTKENLPENGDGIYNREAKKWEFSDAIKADIEVAVIIGIDTDDEDVFLDMADKNRTEGKLISGRVLPNIDAVIKNTCKLMDAQDYISGKSSDFDTYFRDQLQNGMYKVEEYYDDEGEEVTEVIGDTNVVRTINPNRRSSKAKKYKIKKDSQGNIMRDNNSNTLTQYGITIYQAQVTGIDWEDSFDTRLDKQKDEVARTQLEKQEAERQYYTAKKEVAKAESNKAKRRGELELKQVEETIAAETRAKVAEQDLVAEKKRLEVAKLRAQSQKVGADAQAYENQRLVSAGLTPQERAKLEKEIAIGVAKELKDLKLPTTYIESGGGGKGGNLLENLIGAEMAKKMLDGK